MLYWETSLPTENWDVINKEEIGLAITLSDFAQITVRVRVDKLIDDQFAGEIHDFRILLLRPNVLANGLHQMRLAETDAAVNEERVVGARRRLRDRKAGGVRNLVVRADHKRFERVSRIEPDHIRRRFS